MTIREIRIISETDMVIFERKVTDFIARNPVENIKFSTTDTKDGVLYSVMLSVIPGDYFAQV
jgi:hypothetical protein